MSSNRLGKIISSMLPRIILIPLALCTVAMLENLSVVDRFVKPITSVLVAETHQSYLFIMLYYIFAYLLSVTITNVLVCTQSEEQLDLKAPREQKARMTGITKRAHSAHQNLLEGFPAFLAAMMVAVLCKVPAPIRFHMAALHFISRVAYWMVYLADMDYFRTFVWLVGFWCNTCLFGWALLPGFEAWFGRVCAMAAGSFLNLKQ